MVNFLTQIILTSFGHSNNRNKILKGNDEILLQN